MKAGFSRIPSLAALAVLGAVPALAAPGSPAAPAPRPAATVRTVSLAEGTCKTIPSAPPVTFALPADYVTRAPASRKPGIGCFWGTAPDLDRAMRDPKGVDFSEIRRGVFWARPAFNVGFDRAKNQFFDGRGSDEPAMKRAFERTGARNVVVKRGSAGPYPTLEFTGDLPAGANHKAGRLSMIYIGLASGSRTLLVNYHPPARLTPADDQIWEQFVSSLRSASPAPTKPR